MVFPLSRLSTEADASRSAASAEPVAAVNSRFSPWLTPIVYPLARASAEPVAAVNSRFSPWLTPIVYPLARRLVLPLYFGDITVSGQEHLPTDGPVILAPTHRARWDAILVPFATGRGVTGRDLRFMVSADEVSGLQGWFIRRLGGFPVDTKRPTIASLRHGVEVLQHGEMLVIFPEGGIFRDGDVHPLKPGLARLAIQAEMSQPNLGVKIVPISLQYSDSYPRWGTTVKIQIDRPFQVADYCQGSAKQDAKRLTADLELRLKELSGQVVPARELAIASHTKRNLPASQSSYIQQCRVHEPHLPAS
ncbi:MAG: 1-acyl-sn-glycerol-3-phosphate acyltransferase [Microcoleus sp. SIO2G3]|nr:1-acyl-sn-glycerol-3-phosphate acyltransferase [Microcoleus sp. SIO2G3]